MNFWSNYSKYSKLTNLSTLTNWTGNNLTSRNHLNDHANNSVVIKWWLQKKITSVSVAQCCLGSVESQLMYILYSYFPARHYSGYAIDINMHSFYMFMYIYLWDSLLQKTLIPLGAFGVYGPTAYPPPIHVLMNCKILSDQNQVHVTTNLPRELKSYEKTAIRLLPSTFVCTKHL